MSSRTYHFFSTDRLPQGNKTKFNKFMEEQEKIHSTVLICSLGMTGCLLNFMLKQNGSLD